MKYTFTIIIPHKNIPKLLQRCLDSIPQREDLQVIIVDDNSDPDIVDFNDFPGQHRANTEIIFTKEGKGAGFARNVGLSKVLGKWVLFADSDDLYSEKINVFLDKYINSEADVIYFATQAIDVDTLQNVQGFSANEKINKALSTGDLNPLRYASDAPWNKIIKMELIESKSIRFHETIAANDVWFSTNVGHYANTVIASDMLVYKYSIRQGSLQHVWRKEVLLAKLKEGYVMNRFLRSINKIEYHGETWNHFMDLRKISYWLFLREAFLYFWKTPRCMYTKHINALFKKYFSKIIKYECKSSDLA